MRILLPLKFYYHRGGDSTYALSLQKLLELHGHEVIPFSTRHPESLPSPYADSWVSSIDFASAHRHRSPRDAVSVAYRSILSFEAWRKIRDLLNEQSVDVAHLQNIHHHLTPSIFYALERKKIPVVWTLHDYVILCPATHFLSQGKRCEACKKVRYHQAILRRCKRGSISASFLAAAANSVHRALDVYRLVDRFIAPSRFLIDKFVEFGFEADRFVHIPHFLDYAKVSPSRRFGDYDLFVGRLSEEKGAEILLRAAAMKNSGTWIVGDGPDGERLKNEFGHLPNVHFKGRQQGRELATSFEASRAVVVPSECYENFPMVVLEAYAHGKPVVASRLGALPEVVREGVTGLLFTPGDSEDLADKLELLRNQPDLAQRMGESGRKWLEEEFGPDQHYQRLMDLYESVTGSTK